MSPPEKAKKAKVDAERVRGAALLLLEACEASVAERGVLGTKEFHSGWCGSSHYDPNPCKQTGKYPGKCAMWLLREAIEAATTGPKKG